MTLKEFVVAILPSLFVAVTMAHFNKRQKKREEEEAAKESARISRDKLQLDLLLATTKLSYATAVAWKRGKANGEVEEGIEQYEKAMESFQDFERDLVVKSGIK